MDDWKLRLRRAREAKQLNKTTFAKLVGVSNATVTDWEKRVDEGGIKELSAPSLAKIHEVLDVDLYWLLTGRGAENVPSVEHRIREVESPPDEAVDDIFRQATEMLETYRLASPAGRERINVVVRDVRSGLAVNQAKPRTP